MIVRDGRATFKDKLMLSPIIEDDSDIEKEVGYKKMDRIIEINKRRRMRQSWSHLTKKIMFFTQMKHNNFFGLYKPDVTPEATVVESTPDDADVHIDRYIKSNIPETFRPRDDHHIPENAKFKDDLVIRE